MFPNPAIRFRLLLALSAMALSRTKASETWANVHLHISFRHRFILCISALPALSVLHNGNIISRAAPPNGIERLSHQNLSYSLANTVYEYALHDQNSFQY